MKKIYLASGSPRRKALLDQIGLKFQVAKNEYEEDMTLQMKPVDLAKHLSKGKAMSIAVKYKNSIIIAADTFVVYKNQLLGKPDSPKAASIALKKISGKNLDVITGFTIMDTGTKKIFSKSVVSKVFIKKLTDEEISNYIATKEPLDKAGSFGIQEKGALFVKKIEGDYSNIMGLPLYELGIGLKKFGVKIL